MLVNDPAILRPDPILSIVERIHGRDASARPLREGVYEIGHFGGSHWPAGYEHYPGNLSVGCYGVCDSVEQLLARCPELEAPGRRFVVTVTRVRGADQPETGGWRWHKWGGYIGDRTPTREYLHDEPEIDEVLAYHVYERRAGANP